MIELKKNAYSPASLAKELEYLISATTIRGAVRKGKLKAQRFGGKNIIITKANAELWLEELPSATEPTNYKGRSGPRKMSEEDKQRILDDEEARARPQRGKRITKKG